MLNYLLQSGGRLSFLELLVALLGYAALVFVMLPVHELAHAGVATLLGDNTPRWHGRLTLNPLRHLDPIGTPMLVLFGIGYAKAVPVNSRNFSNVKRGMLLTSLAGPLSNVLMALISLLLYRIIRSFSMSIAVINAAFILLVEVFTVVNLNLAVFNLLPLPPLDGFRIFSSILPGRWVFQLERYHEYLRWGVLILVFTGILDGPLSAAIGFLGNLLCTLVGLPRIFA